MPRRIGILGHVGNGNLGDEAIIEALILGIRAVESDAVLTAFTMRPADTEARHGIPTHPLRAHVRRGRPFTTSTPQAPPADRLPSFVPPGGSTAWARRIPGLRLVVSRLRAFVTWLREAARESAFWVTRYRQMRRTDLLIIAGSNQLSDYFGGPWGFPYTIWAWTMAARLAGARVAFLSVGAGPIRGRLSRYFIRSALAKAGYHSFRDAGSRDAIEAIGVGGPHAIAPDLAYGVATRANAGANGTPAGVGRKPRVVIIPLPHFDPRSWAEHDPAVYRRYVETIGTFAATLLARGYDIRFVPTQLRVDPPVVADIIDAMETRARVPGDVAPVVSSFDDLMALLGSADFVVATRFHGLLLSQMIGKPTIGIVYRPSMRDHLVDVGQADYALDIWEITPDRLLERLEALERDSGAGRRIQERIDAYRVALAAQYATLLQR